MPAASLFETVPPLFDLRPPGRAPGTTLAHRRLLRHVLERVHAVGAFALYAFKEDGALSLLDSSGYSEATTVRLAQKLSTSSQLKGFHAAARTLFLPRPTDGIEAAMPRGEPVPEWLLAARSEGAAGVLVGAGGPAHWTPEVQELIAGTVALSIEREQEVVETFRAYEFARSTLRDVPIGLIAIDPLGRVIFLNAAAEQILGTSVGTAVGGDSLRVFHTLVDGENVLLQGLDAELPPIEIWIRRSDGRELPVELRLFQVRAQEGKVRGVVGAFVDLTNLRAMQEQLRHRDRLATIGELAAGIAHEIGNPLTGIRGCAQVLRDRHASEEASSKLIEAILEEVDRLSRLTQQVRHFVRPRPPRMQRCHLRELVDRVVELSAARADEEGISVHTRFADDVPDIYLDPDHIQQVLHNLVTNAIDAMRGRGGRLGIDARLTRQPVALGRRRGRRSSDRFDDAPKPKERAYVRLAVEDTGPGMSEEQLVRAFHPFFTTKPDGIGLGLSISQTIVGEHAGFLSAISQEGKGTTFLLDLPVDRRAE